MDFSLDPDQQSLVDLARGILARESTPERLAELDRAGTWLDEPLWQRLVEAGLVGAVLSDATGFAGLALVCEQVGAHVAQVPYLETALTALALDVLGTEQQRPLVEAAVAGRRLLTLALTETGRESPLDVATRVDAQGRVTGVKTSVPFAGTAHRVLVAARGDQGVELLLVDPAGDGVTLREGTGANGVPLYEVELQEAQGERLARHDLPWLVDRALVALAATGLGVSSTALRVSASYTTEREQFGRPVATFQAVGHRLADAYVDVEGIRLTTLHALWLLDAGEPAHDEARIAKWWASEGGHRVAHAAQHVHGGVGVDTDYPLHRYFLWSKQVEHTLGSATQQLLALGASLAADPA